MLPTQTVSSPPGRASMLRSIVSLLIINVAIPFGCYTLLKAHNASDVTALGVAAIAPALDALISVLRGSPHQHHLTVRPRRSCRRVHLDLPGRRPAVIDMRIAPLPARSVSPASSPCFSRVR